MFLKRQKRDSNKPRKDDKKNRSSTKYGQVRLRPARRGIYSCLFALAGFMCQVGLLISAYVSYGQAPAVIGSLGLIVIVVSVAGVVYGINGFREREKSYKACKLGVVFNILIILTFIMLFVRGMF